MIKLLSVIFLIIIVVSCNDQHEGNGIRPETRERKEVVDDFMKTIGSEDFEEAKAGSSASPVEIISATIIKRDYSKGFTITFKNRSTKPIDAIKFLTLTKNNWGELEATTHAGTAYSHCETQKIIDPGKAISQSWEFQTGDPTKVECVVSKVHFVDGSVWDINN